MASKYDDTGWIKRNDRREKDQHPHFKGGITLSHATLKRLLEDYQDKGEASLYFAIWRKDGDPDKMSVKVDKPRDGSGGRAAFADGGAPRDRARSGGRDDRGYRREDPPFDDDPRDARDSRRAVADPPARRERPRTEDFEDPWGDDP